MRIFITGADGMLGTNLVRMLLERGHELTVFINSASCSGTLDGLNIKRFTGSILEPETIKPAMEGNEVVIHGAASTAVWPARSEIVRRINIEGTRNVVEEALRLNVKRFIYIGSGSSVNAPGETGGKYIFPGAKYGLDYIDSKYEALNLVIDAARERSLPAISILPTYMIDAYDSLPGSGRMIQAVAKGQLKFYTGGGRNFVSAKDVATAIINSLEMGEVGKYYIAGNENLTYREFFAKVARIVGRPSPKIMIPGFLVKAIGLMGDITSKIFGAKPMLSYPMARISCDKQYVSSESAVTELKMPQTPIEVGITDCFEWFVDNGYLDKK